MPDVRVERSLVHREPGRFAGWPANYGMWCWGDEVVAVFAVGWTGRLDGLHARDLSRPFEPVQARSHDGGRTWTTEPFTGTIPTGARSLSADEHVEPRLRVGPRVGRDDFVPLEQPVDFTDPETVLLCARTGLERGSWSWFYVSRDRARHWSGPFLLPDPGTGGIAARTDVVPLGERSALLLLTVPKSDGAEGRVLAVRTDDGGRSFHPAGWVGPEPTGFAIMPSSRRLPDGSVLTAVRRAGPADRPGEPYRHWIDVHRSSDAGANWSLLGTAVDDTGPGGNPPALVALPDGRLVISYGYRSSPFGLRAVVSTDDGRSWSEPLVLTDDCAVADLGYPRSVLLGDTVLTVYYANAGAESERFIEAVRWIP